MLYQVSYRKHTFEALLSEVPTEHWSLPQHQLPAMSNPCGVCTTQISTTLHAPYTEGDLFDQCQGPDTADI